MCWATSLKKYNNTKHSRIGMTPVKASKDKNEKGVYESLYAWATAKKYKPEYNLGDYLRM